MNILFDISTPHNLHHAYILEGDRELLRNKLLSFIEEKLKYPIQGNPDFWHEQYESFSIDDARNLKDRQSTKALIDNRKVFVIETLGMTVEAQNSLLKIFEEPQAGTHFFIIVPSAEIFLPTLRSRVVIIRDKHAISTSEEAQIFLRSGINDRLNLVADIIEEKDKARAISLVDDLICALHATNFQNMFVLETLLKSRAYLSDRSPSLKLILEHMALIVPVFHS